MTRRPAGAPTSPTSPSSSSRAPQPPCRPPRRTRALLGVPGSPPSPDEPSSSSRAPQPPCRTPRRTRALLGVPGSRGPPRQRRPPVERLHVRRRGLLADRPAEQPDPSSDEPILVLTSSSATVPQRRREGQRSLGAPARIDSVTETPPPPNLTRFSGFADLYDANRPSAPARLGPLLARYAGVDASGGRRPRERHRPVVALGGRVGGPGDRHRAERRHARRRRRPHHAGRRVPRRRRATPPGWPTTAPTS